MSYSPPAVVGVSATDRNLWQAIVAEAIANLTYTAYANKAREDGYPEVAEVFEEVARAETQHGLEYLAISGAIDTTAVNLANVIAGETREYTRTYPRMINDAMSDGRSDAVDILTAAMEEEKEHQIAFSDALARLQIDSPNGAPAEPDFLISTPSPAATDADLLETSAERPALPIDLQTYVDAALALDKEPFRVANLGRLREVVFGAQDGIISTLAVTTSLAIAVGTAGTVLVAGFAAAAAGMISMAAGAYLGSRAEEDVREAAIANQVRELEENPAEQLAELVILFQREGNTYENAVHLANEIASNQNLWLNTLLEKKLGISPDFGGSPLKDALAMCVSFGGSAIIPIIPFLFLAVGPFAIGLSVTLSLVGLFVLGLAKGRVVSKSPILQGLEILGIGAASAALGYALGEALPRILGF
ncbi:MAG: VIT1/CCC1 transporter family protein [Chloroflexota bacterium]|nr:VIT1/CCC1 transporter family protein [Chloroflexota bacterium]MDE2962040.1 VIT1/CCC1 transporter family protein [Chloroflexota bacterium]